MAKTVSTMLILGLSAAAFHHSYKKQNRMAFAEAGQTNTTNDQENVDDPLYNERKDGRANGSAQPNPLEIPRLIAQREADKRKEYAERAKVNVREILNDKDLAGKTIKATHETDSNIESRKAPADPNLLVSQD